MSETEIIARVEGDVGRITLNRPKAINAVTFGMVRLITAALEVWEQDLAVLSILIDAAGDRGFSAGGDIRSLWDSARNDAALPEAFLAEEYRLDLRIARSRKPFVSLMDGLVMGGGIGLSAHAAHRVVTERTSMALPEVSIGFTPDVGGSYLLSRAPGQLGFHLGLTAGRWNGADAIMCGMADVFIPATRLPKIADALQGARTAQAVRGALNGLAEPPPPAPLASARGWIDAAYAAERVEDIVAALAAREEPDAQAAAASILRHSPSAVKVALRALRQARSLGGLAQCLEQEYRLAMACVRRPDFVEGVRAQVIDKDRFPRWSPATLAEVTPEMVDAYFAAHAGPALDL